MGASQSSTTYWPFIQDILIIIVFAFLTIVTAASFAYIEMTHETVENNPTVCNQKNVLDGVPMISKIGTGMAFSLSAILFCVYIYYAYRDYNYPPSIIRSYSMPSQIEANNLAKYSKLQKMLFGKHRS